jgi:hypothetical protein
MALTMRRWIALAAVGMAMVAVIVLRDAPRSVSEHSPRDVLAARRNRAIMQAQLAGDELRLRELMDSVQRAITPSAAPVLHVDASFDARTRAQLDSVLAGVRRSGREALIPTRVIVLADRHAGMLANPPAVGYSGALALTYMLPAPQSSEPCVVIARVRIVDNGSTFRNRITAELASATTRERFMGPCAYYEAFGPPGPRIDTWLRARGWAFGQRAEWTLAPSRLMPPQWYDGRIPDLHELMDTEGARCAIGDADACLRGLTEPERNWRLRVAGNNWVSTARFNPFTQDHWFGVGSRLDFGPREWTILSEMVRELGPTRFGTFWRSNASPPEAFQAAAGESIADWMTRWITSTYRSQTPGPHVSWRGALLALLLVVTSVAAALGVARRRVLT